jgi:hypothetical protein
LISHSEFLVDQVSPERLVGQAGQAETFLQRATAARVFLEFLASYRLVGSWLSETEALQFPGARGFLSMKGKETERLSTTIRFPILFP